MKKIFFYAIASSALSSIAFSYEDIDDALKNGVSSGDVSIYIDGVRTSKATSDFHNGTYSLVSMGLYYKSAFYKNARISIGFRSAQRIWQDHNNTQWGYSHNGLVARGDMAMSFDPYSSTMVADTYVEYFDGDTSMKTGRIYSKDDWIDSHFDGIWVRNRSLENLMIEGYYIGRIGDVRSDKMYGFKDINTHNAFGYTSVGAKYYVGDILWIKAYASTLPEVFSSFGGKVSAQYKISNSKIGIDANISKSFEHKYGDKRGDGFDFDTTFFVGANGLELRVGYINTGNSSGWGSLDKLGDNISPFFYWGGEALKNGKDAHLFFGTLSANIDMVGFMVTYGTTGFDTNNIYNARQNEVNVSLKFNFTQKVYGLLNVSNTHLDGDVIPLKTRINGGISLSF